MGLVDVYHAEHKARLARLGGIAKPAPVVAPRVVKPKPPAIIPVVASRYWPQMWFWELVSFTPRFPNRSIVFYPGASRVEHIQKIVCRQYGISRHDMLSARRTAKLVIPRQVAIYLTKELTPRSFSDIGRYFNRDHTTVLHAVRKIAYLTERDPILAAHIEDLKAEILAS